MSLYYVINESLLSYTSHKYNVLPLLSLRTWYSIFCRVEIVNCFKSMVGSRFVSCAESADEVVVRYEFLRFSATRASWLDSGF